jgi:hypothetical protein
MYFIEARAAAGIMAAMMLPNGTPAEVVELATQFLAWIQMGPLVLEVSSLTYEQGSATSVPTRISAQGGRPMATMSDSQQVTAHVRPEDSKGFDTTDAGLSWSADDGGAVVNLQPSDDGTSCTFVGVAPGTANYTVSDGTRSAVGAVTVQPGDVAQLAVTEDAPVDQAPAAPPAGP